MDKRQSTISAIAVLIVNLGVVFGVSVDQDSLVLVLGSLATLIATVWGVWRNHNFTYAAQQGQLVTNQLKNEKQAKHARID